MLLSLSRFLLLFCALLIPAAADAAPNILFWSGGAGDVRDLKKCRSSFKLFKGGNPGSDEDVVAVENAGGEVIIAAHSDGSVGAQTFINRLSAKAKRNVKYIDFEGFAPNGGGNKSRGVWAPAVSGLKKVVCVSADGAGDATAPNRPYLIRSRGCQDVVPVPGGAGACGVDTWCLHFHVLKCEYLK